MGTPYQSGSMRGEADTPSPTRDKTEATRPFAPLLDLLFKLPNLSEHTTRCFIRLRRATSAFSSSHATSDWTPLSSAAASASLALHSEAEEGEDNSLAYGEAANMLDNTMEAVAALVQASSKRKRKNDMDVSSPAGSNDGPPSRRPKISPTLQREPLPEPLAPEQQTPGMAKASSGDPPGAKEMTRAMAIYELLSGQKRPEAGHRLSNLFPSSSSPFLPADAEAHLRALESATEQPSSYDEAWQLLTEIVRPLLPERRLGLLPQLRELLGMTSLPASDERVRESLEPLVRALSTLCAPARDDSAAFALRAITSHSPLRDCFRRSFELVIAMREDLATFEANTSQAIGEDGLRRIVEFAAKDEERRALLLRWGTVEAVILQTRAWCGGRSFDAALLDAVFSPHGVGINWDASATESATGLPPALWIHMPSIFRLQNQVLLILCLGCLGVLAGPPPPGVPPDESWRSNVVVLLETVLQGNAQMAADDPVRLVNLADVMSQARPDREGMKEAVERVLRTEDPVWNLLKARLRVAMSEALVRGLSVRESYAPASMRTGRLVDRGANATHLDAPAETALVPKVRGLEEAVVHERIERVVTELKRVRDWAASLYPLA